MFPDSPESLPPVCRRPQRANAMGEKRAAPLPVECIVRGYLAGSGWKDYQRTGAVCGIALPEGLVDSSKLPEPIFTPSTKAEGGSHDENISFETLCGLIGKGQGPKRCATSASPSIKRVRKRPNEKGSSSRTPSSSSACWTARSCSSTRVLTPDSSRFWPLDQYKPGGSQGELRQAVPAGLPVLAGLGQESAPSSAARRGRRKDPGEIPGSPFSG